MSGPSDLDEVRGRAQAALSQSGVAQDVRADVQLMANMALTPAHKYRHLGAEAMLRDNTAARSRQQVVESLCRLVKALSILEKYGCNLTCPARPRYWRSVKHNNPVFRTTVDAIKGGRRVLFLFGYTNQQVDGLSFPEEVVEPDTQKVAAVTLEVMTLRTEVDLIVKGSHPHLQLFREILPLLVPQDEPPVEAPPPDDPLEPPLVPVTPEPAPSPGPEPPKPGLSLGPEPPKPGLSLGAQPPKPGLNLAPEPPKPGLSLGAQPLKPGLSSGPEPGPEPAAGSACSLCGGPSSLVCPSCDGRSFCDMCDGLFHRHPSRAAHKRLQVQRGPPASETCGICGVSVVQCHCSSCSQSLCLNCDRLFHSHPDRKGHDRTPIDTNAAAKTSRPSLSPWRCSHCTTVNETRAVLCSTCERPRLASSSSSSSSQENSSSTPTSPNTDWQCKNCTFVNAGSSILCEVCERPRLATRPSITPSGPAHSGPTADNKSKWTCQHCTYVNTQGGSVCEMCDLGKDSPGDSLPQSLQQTPPPPCKDPPPPLGAKPEPKPRVNLDQRRQRMMKEDGLNLIQQIREAERRGVTPEEVFAALSVCGGSSVSPCDWLTSELPHLLDEICAMAASVQLNYRLGEDQEGAEPQGAEPRGAGPPEMGGRGPEDVKLSRAEAKLAWLTAGGNTERAVRQLLRDRQAKMRELHSLGFRDVRRCEEALRLSGGEVKGALSLLQRPLMEPFHQHIWAEQPEPPIDPRDPDKQRMCRRLLALYSLPSWGRCELVLALLQEPDVTYSLEDVVQAVKESHDKDFIRRLLNNECPCCLCIFPRSKMQSLTSCQCSVCHECFGRHFTVAVRDKHIRDMVCPVCGEPDINDPEQLDSYFSTLDIQLRDCLELDVYELFHKKLTEHALMKDPKFLWCCHCTSGFINDGDQLKVTCPACRKSFCAQCKKPWEAQHQNLSCEQFQLWKRENDPEYQRLGLAGYLRDNGITCPHCRFQYDLTKGGCMHFSCTQCRYQFCSGCNNPYHKTGCKTAQCSYSGLHAHHPRDCLFYLRDWEPRRLQNLLQKSGVDFNTEPSDGTQADACGVMEQKDEGGQHNDSPCGVRTQPGQAGLCERHYGEYLVSLINGHSLDPALLYDPAELLRASERHLLDVQRGDAEDDDAFHSRLLKNLMDVPLGEKVPRIK